MSSGRITVDLDRISASLTAVRDRVGPRVHIACVVKCNAYGLGVDAVVPELMRNGCSHVMVMTLSEGIQVRRILQDIPGAETTPVITLGGFGGNNAEDFVDHDVTPALCTIKQLRRWSELSVAKGKRLRCWLQLDSGMNRLGLEAPDALALGASGIFQTVRVDCIMSHLATADTNLAFAQQQRTAFVELATELKRAVEVAAAAANDPHNVLLSLANSRGICLGSDFHFDVVRPGVALYMGLDGNAPAVDRVEVPIIATRNVDAGACVGYDMQFVTQRKTSLVAVQLGYGDGTARAGVERRSLFWSSHGNAYRCPIVAVSMDSVMVDVTDIPEANRPEEDEWLELVGEHQSVRDVAAFFRTIPNEVLTSLSRFEKRYRKSAPEHRKLAAPPKEMHPSAAAHIYALVDLVHGLMRQQGIRYYLEGGSLIGQVRDGGIIRFDDDADVQIHPDDMELFERAVPFLKDAVAKWSTAAQMHLELRRATFGYKLILSPAPTDEEHHWDLYFKTLGGHWAPGFAIVDFFFMKFEDGCVKYVDDVISKMVYDRGYGDISAERIAELRDAPFGPIHACVPGDAVGATKDVFGPHCLDVVECKAGEVFDRKKSVAVDFDSAVFERLKRHAHCVLQGYRFPNSSTVSAKLPPVSHFLPAPFFFLHCVVVFLVVLSSKARREAVQTQSRIKNPKGVHRSEESTACGSRHHSEITVLMVREFLQHTLCSFHDSSCVKGENKDFTLNVFFTSLFCSQLFC